MGNLVQRYQVGDLVRVKHSDDMDSDIAWMTANYPQDFEFKIVKVNKERFIGVVTTYKCANHCVLYALNDDFGHSMEYLVFDCELE